MQDVSQDPGRLAVLDDLRRTAAAAYGQERAADPALAAALDAVATVVWRVMAEPLDPFGPEPTCHG